MEDVSIIVPVYNSHKRIIRCIDSISKQTYRNYSVILVDDGSTDGTSDLCDELALANENIVVIHSENRGVSSARNIGLKNARGKYVVFVDSDDWLSPTAIEKMVLSIQGGEIDLVAGSKMWIDGFKNVPSCYDSIVVSRGREEWSEQIVKLHFAVWAKLFKRDIIENNNIMFPENIKYSEDTIFLCNYLRAVQRIAFIREVIYFENRLYDNTAIKKLYPEYNKWQEKVVECFNGIIDEKHITIVVENRLYNTCIHYACNNTVISKETILLKMHESFLMLHTYAVDFSLINKRCIEHKLFELLEVDQTEEAYAILTNKPKKTLRLLLSKCLYWTGRYVKRMFYYHEIFTARDI